MLKAASLRQRGYRELNTIARARYLNGANELEGKLKPGALMGLGMALVSGGKTGPEILAAWRYQVDPQKAGDTRLSVGINFTDSGETYQVALRNSILEVRLEVREMSLPESVPVVSLSAARLRAILAGETVGDIGDADALGQLIGYLDRDQRGFSMHLR
jgi:alkyl sulfatase BDS1-like metallo-beta-lactamase superfamily hydrolase